MNVHRVLQSHGLPHADAFLGMDAVGFDAITVVAKLTWSVKASGACRLHDEARAIRMSDLYRRGAASSLERATDRVPYKPGTDVFVSAHALPPPGHESDHLDVGLRLETGQRTLEKQLRVFGRRVFMQGVRQVVPGPAEPLSEPVPLIYELAAGGRDPGHADHVDHLNPVGVGHRRNPAELVGQEAHRIECLGGTHPAGLGPIPRHWAPRSAWFGTTDAAYYRERHPVAPEDFDPRHYTAAHPDLWSPEPLRGDEPMRLTGMTPEGVWSFRLPHYAPRFIAVVDGEEQALDTHLDTIFIDLEDLHDRVVELCWRVSVKLPSKSERLESITITDETPVPRAWYVEEEHA
ncbi:MAG: DUF2169 domain-containing protein [Myxococcales bacterium]|nr:DUF2169 domain-containing protein [Myxococcales bacterium]